MRRAACACAAAALLAGCGGGDNRLTASEYRARATKICGDSRRETNALGRPTTTSQFKTFLARGIRVTERNLRRLQSLRPPEDLLSKHRAIIDAERRGLDELRDVSSRLHGDARDVPLLRRAQPALRHISVETGALYRAAGLDRCAQA